MQTKGAATGGRIEVSGNLLMKEYAQAQMLGKELGASKIIGDGKKANQGIEGLFELANGTKVPYSLKYKTTSGNNAAKNIFESIYENSNSIKNAFDKNLSLVKDNCKFGTEANTYLRIDAPNVTKTELVNFYDANKTLSNGLGILFGVPGTYKQIKIIAKNGETITFDKSYTLIN